MKLLLADDHDLVRETLAAFLEREDDIQVVQAGDLPQALQLVVDNGAFDLILHHYNMPGMDGLNGLTKAKEANGGKPVGLISGSADKHVAERALAAGAAGFMPKTLAAKSMIHAVRFMSAGEIFAPIAFMTADDELSAAEESGLTTRELQVLGGLADGLSNKEIARELDLQEVTIKLHVKTLTRKLDARNRTHAAMIGRERGLI